MIERSVKKIVYRLDRQLYRVGLRSVKALALPTFIGLGAGQSGTTWLFKHLSNHPEIFMPPRKEVHYFDRQFDQWPLSYYASLFQHPTKKIRGECSPGYSILRPERIAAIGEIVPDVRLILIIRNPIERSWSGLRRLLAKQNKTTTDFDDATLYEVLDKEWMYRGDQFEELKGEYAPGLLEGFYTRAIDNWLGVFQTNQLLVTFFDDIRHSPMQFLNSVCQHIGVASEQIFDPSVLQGKVNANPQEPMPPRFERFLRAKYLTEIEALQARYGGPCLTWLKSDT